MENVPEITSYLEALTGMHALSLNGFFDVHILNSYSLEELRSLLIMIRFVQRAIRNCVSVQVW